MKLTDKALPLELQRITTIYVDTEDRIGLVGEDDNGEHHKLWLTQRLLNLLVDRLLLWLPQSHEGIQVIAQQVAQAKHEPEHPVIANSACVHWLVKEITLVPSQGVIGLLFKSDGDQHIAMVRFNEISLRQWLGIVFRQYQQAQWSGVEWPSWFLPEVELGLPEGVAVH